MYVIYKMMVLSSLQIRHGNTWWHHCLPCGHVILRKLTSTNVSGISSCLLQPTFWSQIVFPADLWVNWAAVMDNLFELTCQDINRDKFSGVTGQNGSVQNGMDKMVYGQNVIRQNGMDKIVRTKWHGQNGMDKVVYGKNGMDKMVWTKW